MDKIKELERELDLLKEIKRIKKELVLLDNNVKERIIHIPVTPCQPYPQYSPSPYLYITWTGDRAEVADRSANIC